MKNTFKQITPPILWKIAKCFFQRFKVQDKPKADKYGWFGSFTSWADAKNESVGYDNDPIIVSLVKKLTIKRRLEFEENNRSIDDSTLRLLSCLNHVINCTSDEYKRFQVLDFGGALGQHFFLLRNFINHPSVLWNVCETEPMVSEGRKSFQAEELKFVNSLDAIEHQIDLVLLSGVLQCIENPIQILEEIIELKPRYLIVDRFPIVPHFDQDKICVQHVNYGEDTSYPSRFFANYWEALLLGKFELLYDWFTHDGHTFDDRSFNFKGYFFKLS